MYSVIRFTTADKANSAIAFEIRQRVFVEEQKVSREEEYDSHEDECSHYLLLVGKSPAGTARWRFTVNGIKLERFAVLPEFRGKGAGTFLVNSVLNDVTPLNKYIYLHAQLSAVNVYKRAGFIEEGDLFYEANIPHYKMVYHKS